MSILDEMSTFLQQGRAPKVKELVAQALNEGISPQEILEQGLLSGMNIIGEKFKNLSLIHIWRRRYGLVPAVNRFSFAGIQWLGKQYEKATGIKSN